MIRFTHQFPLPSTLALDTPKSVKSPALPFAYPPIAESHTPAYSLSPIDASCETLGSPIRLIFSSKVPRRNFSEGHVIVRESATNFDPRREGHSADNT
mmetsp:Transcript_5808/g.22041  ORF Transcript_5808/g.22041 Transcript_5808/m.22041 type:complete len:98 (+) Transcript_5808:3125-3418(+)